MRDKVRFTELLGRTAKANISGFRELIGLAGRAKTGGIRELIGLSDKAKIQSAPFLTDKAKTGRFRELLGLTDMTETETERSPTCGSRQWYVDGARISCGQSVEQANWPF